MIHKIFNSTNTPNETEKKEIIDFLFAHLEEYGDREKDIEKAIDFALKKRASSLGGFILIAKDNEDIAGIVVVNRTGMQGYIPENILVYIATHKEQRGKGVGKQLMNKAIEIAEGDIALHVEPDNPARFLYEKVGFTSKYIEMRYTQK